MHILNLTRSGYNFELWINSLNYVLSSGDILYMPTCFTISEVKYDLFRGRIIASFIWKLVKSADIECLTC